MPHCHATMPPMRRILTLLALGSLALAACAQDEGPDLARYYDERGMFTVDLPSDNDFVVTPPQPAQDGPGLLTGVVSSPPAPSPQPQSAFGGGLVAPSDQPDQTIYQAFVVTSDSFEDVEEMALYFLTGDPAIDVLIDDRTVLAGQPGKLVVADAVSEGTVTAGVAVALTLGDGETGYLVAAIFAPGGWEGLQRDFEDVVASFRSEVPPGLMTFPLGAEGS